MANIVAEQATPFKASTPFAASSLQGNDACRGRVRGGCRGRVSCTPPLSCPVRYPVWLLCAEPCVGRGELGCGQVGGGGAVPAAGACGFICMHGCYELDHAWAEASMAAGMWVEERLCLLPVGICVGVCLDACVLSHTWAEVSMVVGMWAEEGRYLLPMHVEASLASGMRLEERLFLLALRGSTCVCVPACVRPWARIRAIFRQGASLHDGSMAQQFHDHGTGFKMMGGSHPPDGHGRFWLGLVWLEGNFGPGCAHRRENVALGCYVGCTNVMLRLDAPIAGTVLPSGVALDAPMLMMHQCHIMVIGNVDGASMLMMHQCNIMVISNVDDAPMLMMRKCNIMGGPTWWSCNTPILAMAGITQ
eukprot:scaffold78239_cov20-Tisochrysis_lutea.AAC.1